jgi:putative transposase
LGWGDCMKPKEVAAKYRADQWIKIIKEQRASGKTVKAFCLERDLSRNAFFYWQRKLREAACENLPAAEQSRELTPAGWMQLSYSQEAKDSIEIEINGCRIKVDNKTDPQLLKSVCSILRTLL